MKEKMLGSRSIFLKRDVCFALWQIGSTLCFPRLRNAQQRNTKRNAERLGGLLCFGLKMEGKAKPNRAKEM
jgi:hypothetical protein